MRHGQISAIGCLVLRLLVMSSTHRNLRVAINISNQGYLVNSESQDDVYHISSKNLAPLHNFFI